MNFSQNYLYLDVQYIRDVFEKVDGIIIIGVFQPSLWINHLLRSFPKTAFPPLLKANCSYFSVDL